MTSQHTIREIVENIDADFARHADEAVIVKYRKYFKEGYHAYGVTAEIYSQLCDAWWNVCRERLSPGDMPALLDELFHGGHYEDQSIAIRFLERMRGEYTPELFGRIYSWFDPCIKNWAHTDFISQKVLAPFLDDGVAELHDFDEWLASPYKWRRRAVPVTLIAVRDLEGRMSDYLDMIRPLMTDGEQMVHKGTGWFLREAWKRNPSLVEDYLLEWKDISPRLIFQYATEKMSKVERERFRRTKK